MQRKTDEPARSGAIAEQLRAGIEQRRAEVAALNELRGGTGLLDLERAQFVEEPVPVSPRPLLGRLIVFSRKAFYQLFLKWYGRSLVQQQNAFNRAATRRIQSLVEQNRSLRDRIETLNRRLEVLEQDRR